MQTFLLYMIKSSTILIVLLTYYQFFLKRQTFFNLNRIFLLGVLILRSPIGIASLYFHWNKPERYDRFSHSRLSQWIVGGKPDREKQSKHAYYSHRTADPYDSPTLWDRSCVFFPSLFNHSMPAMLIRSSKSTQTITWIVYDPNSGRPTYFLLL